MPRSRLATSMLAASVTLLPFLRPDDSSGAGFDRGAPSIRQDAVLTGVYSATRQLLRQGVTPVNVFDLDATVFDAGGRHKAIMAEFARKNSKRYPEMAAKVEKWVTDTLPYDVKESFAGIGIHDPAEIKRAKTFWDDRFFTHDYLRHDHPIAGAPEYVKSLHGLGSVVVYLTGRNDKRMRLGTERTLAHWGFPIGGDRAFLIMSPRRGLHDAEFKGSREVHDQIASYGQVVGIFDNEPGNVNALARSFPEALTVFLDTNHTPKAPPVDTGIPWIHNFRWSWQEGAVADRRLASTTAGGPDSGRRNRLGASARQASGR